MHVCDQVVCVCFVLHCSSKVMASAAIVCLYERHIGCNVIVQQHGGTGLVFIPAWGTFNLCGSIESVVILSGTHRSD